VLAIPRTIHHWPVRPAVGWPALSKDAVGCLFVVFGVILTLRPPIDPDLGWHLRNGQTILATRGISHIDQFSFTMAGAPLNNFEWLWDVLAASVNQAAGWPGMALANALTVGLTLCCIYLTLRFRRVAAPFAAAGIGLAMLNLAAYEDFRPGMAGALMSAACLLALDLYRRRPRWRVLAALGAVEVVWANLHASFVLGPGLCALYAAGALRERKHGVAMRLGVMSFLLIGLACLNPAGANLMRFTLGASRLPFNRNLIQEWMPPDFREAAFLPLTVTVLISIGLPLLLRTRWPEPHRAALLLAGTLAVFQSVQFLPFYAVAAVPVLAEMAQDAFNKHLQLRLRVPHVLLCCALLVGLLGIQLQRLQPDSYEGILAKRFPTAAVSFIEREQLRGPMWNDFDWGSYLIWALPRLPVFVDGRAELYGQNFLQRYIDVSFGRTPANDVLDEYGIRLVLIAPNSALATELRQLPSWQEAFHDQTASVFVRR
jgi:hypothetical protein